MPEALFSLDGWGCQHVNQDTNWEVPSSPEPANKDTSGAPVMWKPTVNNGTDLWEMNLRNGGQPPTQPVQKTPWGHTPSTNLGGTWGEDDDCADGSSVWTGASNNPSTTGAVGATATGPQWGQSAVGVGVGAASNASGAPPVNIGGVSAVAGAVGGPGVNVPGSANPAIASSSLANNWGDTREMNSGAAVNTAISIRGVDPRGATGAEIRDLRRMDPRDPIRGDPRGISGRLNGTSEMWGQHHSIAHNQIPAMNKVVGPSSAMATSAVATTGGVSGIPPGGINTINPVNVSGTVNAHWGATPVPTASKDIPSLAGKVSGWEEPSPPTQRRNISSYDDGTSVWGQQSRVTSGGGGQWKDISDPMNRHLSRSIVGNQNNTNPVVGLGGGPGNVLGNQGVLNAPVLGSNTNNPLSAVGPQGRIYSAAGPGIGVNPHKPDNNMWAHANNPNVNARNSSSWGDESNHNVGPNTGVNWMEDKTNASIGQLGVGVGGPNTWNEPPISWNKTQNKIPGATTGWGAGAANDGTDLSSDWSNHGGILGKPQQKINVNTNIGNMNTDVIKQSKQYRILVENGFKKEDVERALLNTNMNMEEAAVLLRANGMPMDWRKQDETPVSYGEHTNTGCGFPGRFPQTSNQANMQFPPNIINNISGAGVGASGNNSNIAALNTIQQIPVQKYLNPTQHNVASGPQGMNAAAAFGQGQVATALNAASNNNSQPSAEQLRVLVQQIQLAVQSGYLSSQILSEPLPSSMLVLLYQLLTNIKHLQAAQQSLTRGGSNANNSQISYAISKYKQQIQNLQNQINAQQTYILKQKQQQSMPQNTQYPTAHASNSNLEYMRGQHDNINALQNNFSEMNLSKPGGYPGAPTSQSKLINQWKLPEKDLTSESMDFSRAPGTTKQNLSNTPSSTMGPLGLQNDGTWSTGRNIGDGWPNTSNETENKDWSVVQGNASGATYTDLVPEFEPGKPWKGPQLKSIEDDPTITPGSVARSPFAINSTQKDTDIFTNPSKSSPTDLTPLSLSSSTWSFNPSSSNPNFQNPQQFNASELWASSMNKTSRGPPPGLGSNKGAGVSVTGVASVSNSSSVMAGNSNGWNVTGGRAIPNNSGWSTTNPGWGGCTWLLLKNLNAQIDASTLRTLCMQHGPLVNFHLYLNQGIALCKYATREEANKAQMTLNNCVLCNTTICAESPSENEVQSILQHYSQSSSIASGNGGNGVNNSKNNGSNIAGGNGSLSSNSGNDGLSGGNSGTGHGSGGSTSSNGNGGSSQSQTSSGGGNSNNNIMGGNGGSSTPSSNVLDVAAQLNQQRPSGRDEYDYISNFVRSIVDD